MSRYPTVPGLLPREEVDSYSQLVSAPGPYLEFGEFLYLEATSTDASATLRFSGKFLSTDGEIRSFSENMVITGTGNQTAVTSRIGPCWLMGFSVRVVAGTITDGEIVASVHVARASASTPVHVMTLASGEVTNTRALGLGAFYAAGSGSSASSTPTIVLATSSPSAGASAIWTVTAGELWEPISIMATFTTSATVATRQVTIFFVRSGIHFGQEISSSTQAASLAVSYSAHRNAGYATATANNLKALILPAVYAQAGDQVVLSSFSLQGGDQFSDCRMQYRSYTV